ncbi:eukaryotic translation elongation factor 1 delta a (guanine nucleotide exchange protein) isoform X2 [Trichomycterus rosablanca]|uniref:eukaryotic translation elongation factor 1 delta a (guanine nucleotide exchange protein) isoform X2 n=1 Tax=Trichomycterus rosablanca TaxID=2290929 RepID=UPI002F35E9BC
MENQRGSQSRSKDSGGHRQDSPHNHQGGRKRRAQRSSHSEGGFLPEGFGPVYGASGEIVWFNSNMYDQAEGYLQSASGLGTSPKEPSAHRSLVFRAKRKPAQPDNSQEEGNDNQPHSFSSQKHQRSSSEPQKGRRERGYSETERTPSRKRDNIIMSGLQCLAQEKVWFDKSRYDEAERCFYEGANGVPSAPQSQSANKSEGQCELISRVKSLELDNQNLHKVVDDLRVMLSKMESRMSVLEKSQSQASKSCPASQAAPAPKPKVVVKDEEEDDDDIDLFGSDEEDEEAERIKAQRVEEYAAKKSKKPALIAKSSIILDVKPWDDETDMAKLEECVRSVQTDGLLWGASKLVPVGYGIKKLQINCVVEDDKVGVDLLEEEITKFEDYVQSVDVAAFNKI